MQRLPVIVTLIITCLTTSMVAQTSRPSNATVFDVARKILKEEAIESRKSGIVARTEQTFADEFVYEMTPEYVLSQLTKKHGSEPFTDAYLRWQLAGLLPPLDITRPDDVQRLTKSGPRFIANPTEARKLAPVVSAGTSDLDERQRERIMAAFADAESRRTDAEILNTAADCYWRWLADECSDPVTKLIAHSAHAQARLDSGWSVDDVVEEIDGVFEEWPADHADIDRRVRTTLHRTIARLGGTTPEVVSSVTTVGSTLVVETATLAIDEAAVARWTSRIVDR